MTGRRWVIIGALTLPLAVGAQVAAPSAARPITPPSPSRVRLEVALDSASFAHVMRIVVAAERQGIPAAPLINKALEGVTLRRPADRVRLSVERLAERLALAQDALAPATAADLVAGAEALTVGVPVSTLRQIRALRPTEPVALPLGILTQLVSSKVPVARASDMVVELLRRKARTSQLVTLSEDVAKDIAIGHDPTRALEVRVAGILAGNGNAAVSTTPTDVEATSFQGPGTTRNPTGRVPAPPTRPRRP